MKKKPAVKITRSALSAKAGLSVKTIERLCADSILPRSATRGGYSLPEAIDLLAALAKHYQQKSAGLSADFQADRAREQKAKAESAEWDLCRKKRELVSVSGVTAIWADFFAKLRMTILNFRPLSEGSRKELMNRILALKLDDMKTRLEDVD